MRVTSSFDRHPANPRVDRIAWFITAIIVSALVIVPKLLQHASLNTWDLDTGVYTNFAWALSHGEGFVGSLLGRHHLGEHFSPIMLLIAPIYLIWPSAYVLMLLQGLAVASAILLAMWFADVRLAQSGITVARFGPGATMLRVGASLLLLVLCFAHPAIIATWQYQFQPIELGLPLLIIAMIALHQRRWVLLAIMVLLVLMTRESAPLSVLGLALYAALVPEAAGGERRARWRLALILTLVAAAWAVVSFGLIMPSFRSEAWGHTQYIGPWTQLRKKLDYLVILVGAFGFLPLVGRRALACVAAAGPGIVLNLITQRESQYAFMAHYDAQILAFLLVATGHGIGFIGQGLLACRERNLARSPATSAGQHAAPNLFAGAVAVGAVVTAIICFDRADARWPHRIAAGWLPDAKSRAIIAELDVLEAKYRTAPAPAAYAQVGPRLAHRPRYMTIRITKNRSSWLRWASRRLEPGTILIVPTELFTDYHTLRRFVRSIHWTEPVERTRYLEVWRWPNHAPPAGTLEAEAFVDAGMREPARPEPFTPETEVHAPSLTLQR
jgi:uncharacterized membrane protein